MHTTSILHQWFEDCVTLTIYGSIYKHGSNLCLVHLVVKSQTTCVTIYRDFMLWVSSLWLHWTGLK